MLRSLSNHLLDIGVKITRKNNKIDNIDHFLYKIYIVNR